MATYVIDAPHTEQECSRAAVEFEKHPRAKELLEKTFWACSSGEHRAWTVAEFASADEARAIVPDDLRDKLGIYPVEVFSFDEMVQAHE